MSSSPYKSPLLQWSSDDYDEAEKTRAQVQSLAFLQMIESVLTGKIYSILYIYNSEPDFDPTLCHYQKFKIPVVLNIGGERLVFCLKCFKRVVKHLTFTLEFLRL